MVPRNRTIDNMMQCTFLNEYSRRRANKTTTLSFFFPLVSLRRDWLALLQITMRRDNIHEFFQTAASIFPTAIFVPRYSSIIVTNVREAKRCKPGIKNRYSFNKFRFRYQAWYQCLYMIFDTQQLIARCTSLESHIEKWTHWYCTDFESQFELSQRHDQDQVFWSWFSNSIWRFCVASPRWWDHPSHVHPIRSGFLNVTAIDRRDIDAIETSCESVDDVAQRCLQIHANAVRNYAFLRYSLWPTCALSAILPGLTAGLFARWRRVRRGDLWIKSRESTKHRFDRHLRDAPHLRCSLLCTLFSGLFWLTFFTHFSLSLSFSFFFLLCQKSISF